MKFEIAAALAATLLVTSAFAQTPKLVTEEMMVKSPDPGIEIYVRNKRPADMTAFRPERTVLFVHGATYPGEHRIRSPARRPVVDGVHRRARLRRLSPRPPRLRQIDAGRKEMAEEPERQSADRARRHRGQGHRRRGRFHPRAPQHSAPQPDRLVVGHRD